MNSNNWKMDGEPWNGTEQSKKVIEEVQSDLDALREREEKCELCGGEGWYLVGQYDNYQEKKCLCTYVDNTGANDPLGLDR